MITVMMIPECASSICGALCSNCWNVRQCGLIVAIGAMLMHCTAHCTVCCLYAYTENSNTPPQTKLMTWKDQNSH